MTSVIAGLAGGIVATIVMTIVMRGMGGGAHKPVRFHTLPGRLRYIPRLISQKGGRNEGMGTDNVRVGEAVKSGVRTRIPRYLPNGRYE